MWIPVRRRKQTTTVVPDWSSIALEGKCFGRAMFQSVGTATAIRGPRRPRIVCKCCCPRELDQLESLPECPVARHADSAVPRIVRLYSVSYLGAPAADVDGTLHEGELVHSIARVDDDLLKPCFCLP